MRPLVFVKLGGSLITRKDLRDTVDWARLRRAAGELAEASSSARLLVGHGGGGFAHPVVEELRGGDPYRLLALCQRATRRLNSIVVDALLEAGLLAVSFQTSVFMYEALDGLRVWEEPLSRILGARDLVPVVYGECVFSEKTGYRVVSTEDVFLELAGRLRPARIVLATTVGGIYTCDPLRCGGEAEHIPVVDRSNYREILEMLGSGPWSDVTGGMRGKVERMLEAARRHGVEIIIVDGGEPGSIYGAVVGERVRGTVIRW